MGKGRHESSQGVKNGDGSQTVWNSKLILGCCVGVGEWFTMKVADRVSKCGVGLLLL